MANFDSVGAGFARGFRGAQAVRLQKQTLEADKAKQQADIILQNLKSSKDFAINGSNSILEQASNLALSGEATPEQLSEIRKAYTAINARHAIFLEKVRGEGQATGVDMSQLSGADFLEQQMNLFNTVVDVGNLQQKGEELEQARDATTSFQARVDGKEIRVTSVKQRGGGAKFFGDQGQEILPSQISPSTSRQAQVTPEFQIPGLTATDSSKVVGELRELGAANNSFVSLANDVIKDIDERPEKIGTVGDVVRGFTSLVGTAKGIAHIFGIDSRWITLDGEPVSIDEIDEHFDFGELADASQEIKATLLDLVFLNLASKGQTGRAVSDRDLEIFMNNTGFNTNEPSVVAAGLRATARNNANILEQTVLARSGGQFTLDQILPGGILKFDEGKTNIQSQLEEVDRLMSEGDFAAANALMDEIERGPE